MKPILTLLCGLALIGAGNFQPYQPLVAGARWNYVCTGGVAATRTMALGAINNQPGYLNTLTLTVPGQPQVQWGELELNESQGMRLGGFSFPPTYPSVQINPPQLEFPVNPIIGQSLSLPDGFGNTLTVTYAGLATVSAPAAVYTGVAVFKETDSGQPPIPFPRTRYMVRGLGEVQMDFGGLPAQNVPAMTCQLMSYNVP